ncbi:MAG: hypothetical protein ACP5T5_01820 [Thermoprotei archaeon]
MSLVFGLIAAAVTSSSWSISLGDTYKSRGYVIQTAVSSVRGGLSSFEFGFVVFYLGASPPCYAAFLGLGTLFLIFGPVRFFVKGALVAYRKSGTPERSRRLSYFS